MNYPSAYVACQQLVRPLSLPLYIPLVKVEKLQTSTSLCSLVLPVIV